jgi:hypothetical protein
MDIEQTTTDVINNVDTDEGVFVDLVDLEEARGLSTGTPLLKNDPLNGMLTAVGPKDSGFSSRMSEADADADEREKERHLLEGHKADKLTKRLTRISECQYGAFYFRFGSSRSMSLYLALV